MRNWSNEWLFPGGKIHRERIEPSGSRCQDMLCGVPVWRQDVGVGDHGEVVMPTGKVPPAYVTSRVGRKYKVRYCKTCIRLSRSERTAA